MSQPSPCCTTPACDPNNEPLASALNNFITAFFGSLTKVCVNDQVTWVLPCNLDSGVTGYPRIAGEGLACYFFRVIEGIIASGGGGGTPTPLCEPSGGLNGVSTSASRCDHNHNISDLIGTYNPTVGLDTTVTVVTSVDWSSPDVTKTSVVLTFVDGVLTNVGAPSTTTITTAVACT